MFAVVVSGRPIITDFEKLSDTQLQFSIPAQPPFNHLVVFTLPGNPLPDGAAAAVYIRLHASQDFSLLGALSNDKQSAIFRIRTTDATTTPSLVGVIDEDMMADSPAPAAAGPAELITLGISLEPAEQVAANLAATKCGPGAATKASDGGASSLVRSGPLGTASGPWPQPRPGLTTKVLAQRIIANAFNFLASFSNGEPGADMVPLKSFEDWWRKFEKKIELDPGFLERETG